MLTMNDLKIGTVVTFKNEPHVVTFSQHVQMGRGSAVVRTKLKSLISGNVLEETFKGGDKFEEADLSRTKASFMYRDGPTFYFMDSQSYEQFGFPREQIGDISQFVSEGAEVEVLNYDGKPVSITLPAKVTLRVTSAPPSVRGDTAQGKVTKAVTTETGLVVHTPIFVKEGDSIRVNTETGEYVERA